MKNDKLFLMYQLAHNAMLEKAKEPNENVQMFVARCWYEAMLIVLNKEGKEICTKQSGSSSSQ